MITFSSSTYYNILFVVTVFSCIYMLKPVTSNQIIIAPNKKVAFLLMFFVVLMLSLLPVSWNTGADRELYAMTFLRFKQGLLVEMKNDILFYKYMKICSSFMNYIGWFILTALIYCYNHYCFAVKLSREYVYLIVLMLFSSFVFYGYGTNTIRAGFAASFLLLALSYYRDKVLLFLFVLVAIACHKSMLIPAIAIVLSMYFNKTLLFLFLWFLSILLSAFLGTYFEEMFSSFTFDLRVSYFDIDPNETHYEVGFRIDFLLYSFVPILFGFYYLFVKRFKDEMYSLLFNTYVLSNSFWILVIRANFSDRFAYLSWFIYPVLLIYPLLQKRIVEGQRLLIIGIVFFHELFTYLMFLR